MLDDVPMPDDAREGRRPAAQGRPEAAHPKFAIGDRVVKREGYAFGGTVVGIFFTLDAKRRIVVEYCQSPGLLHIFNENQFDHACNEDLTDKEPIVTVGMINAGAVALGDLFKNLSANEVARLFNAIAAVYRAMHAARPSGATAARRPTGRPEAAPPKSPD